VESSSVGVSGSPVMKVETSTPKMGLVSEQAASALVR